jgi:DGQHR domain-containing protein
MTSTQEEASPMTDKRSNPTYGATPFPGISYKIGGRQFVVAVAPVTTYVGMVGEREAWDPLTGSGTNRKEDKAHRQRIAAYIQDTEDYVLNSVVIYADEGDARFEPNEGATGSIMAGTLYIRPGSKLKVGDGGHRTSAFGDVITAHAHGDDVLERLQANGQPIVVVFDDSPASRAQDFVDLQRNAKPLNTSVAESMDRRKQFNKMILDDVVKADTVALFDGGKRVEFLVDSPGKLSNKIAGFKTVRYASGTLVAGTGHRSTAGWNEAVEEITLTDDHAADHIAEFWQSYSELPAVAAALVSGNGIVGLRKDTWLTSANVMYSIAAAVHACTRDANNAPTGRSISDAMKALHDVDFTRGADTFYGTLVEPGTDDKPDKGLTGRDAWEGAAAVLAKHISERTTSPART